MAGADEDGVAIAGGEGLNAGAKAGDARGADEDHLQRAAGEGGYFGEDRGVILATISVAFDRDVEGVQRFLRGVRDVLCEEDSSSAGAECRFGVDEGGQGVEEVVAFQEFEDGGGLATGNDEGVDFGESIGRADEARGCSEGGENASVGVVGSLQREDTYGEG